MQGSENAAMFSRIAHRYDLLNHLLSFNIDRRWRGRLVAAANPVAGASVLDACAGTGDVALEFARRTAVARIVGVDISPGMIRVGRGKDPGRRIEWVEADVLDLPFADERFDAATLAFGLRNLSDYRSGVSELARVLKPGGRLAVLEFSPPDGGVFQRIYRLYLRLAVPAVGAVLSGSGGAYRYLASSVRGFLPRESVLKLMAAAGLRNLGAERLAGGIAYIYTGEK